MISIVNATRILGVGVIAWLGMSLAGVSAEPINREALVRRHNPAAAKMDPLSPFSVGNGGFAFTADITGLQTFPNAYQAGIPLHTESEWGWHSFPNTEGHQLADTYKDYDTHGRPVPYASSQTNPAANFLRANPHRIDLGRIGLILKKKDGGLAQPEDLSGIRQSLDLWTGILTSEFIFDGEPVKILTACHPSLDRIAVEINSPLLAQGRAGISIAFPGAKAEWKENADWDRGESHRTVMNVAPEQRYEFTRTLDATTYHMQAHFPDKVGAVREVAPHRYEYLSKNDSGKLSATFEFSANPPTASAGTVETFQASTDHWKHFWSTGGAIDFTGSTDPRAAELERRIVLSQYLTAIQCAGSMPPQETGLTYNSWFGKPHTEMHWWHATQFALWGRPELLERSLPWYDKILPVAQALAKRQGYKGARWPKMVGPEGEESPSKVAAMLIWEQPHPIYYAELCYRAHPTPETLKKYSAVVFQTAEFMADFAHWNEAKKRYELGPPCIPAQECYEASTTMNPTYELAYWHWALSTAQQWRERLGMEREPTWEKVLTQLSRPHVKDGIYTAIETPPFTNTNDHPSMLGAYGFLPQTPLIDPPTMSRTYDWVLKNWDWPTTWGWDYPMMAMTAARLGSPDDAVKALLMNVQKNTYLPNGHNYQDERLTIYLPGNGGLLSAAAMMATGWDHSPTRDAPGFPKDGKWKVRSEGLVPMP